METLSDKRKELVENSKGNSVILDTLNDVKEQDREFIKKLKEWLISFDGEDDMEHKTRVRFIDKLAGPDLI